jgi:flagellar biosynthetic protein FliQ
MLFVLVDGWTLVVGSLLESFVVEGHSSRASAFTASLSARRLLAHPPRPQVRHPRQPAPQPTGGRPMTQEAAIELIRDTFMIVLTIAVPLLLAGMVIGLVVSLFQSVTSIQDQTLTFVPKIIIIIVVAVLLTPWMIELLSAFTHEMLRLF